MNRIENIVAAGTPDVHYVYNGLETWIELKAPKTPKRETTALLRGHLSPEQINWQEQYFQNGRLGFVAARDDDRTVYLFPGHIARSLDSLPLREAREYRVANWNEFYGRIECALKECLINFVGSKL